MKNLNKKVIVTMKMLLIGASLQMHSSNVLADDDVYNFYFQKGGAPQSVSQGGRGQSVVTDETSKPPKAPELAPTPVLATPQIATTAIPTPDESKFKPYTILLGVGHIEDSIGTSTAYSVGGQYNFNKFLGVRGVGHINASESDRNKVVLADSNQSSNRYGGYGAIAFTPIHIELVGHQLIEVSALAGAMSYREKDGPAVMSGGVEAYNVRTMVKGFLGAEATFSVNENVGVELFASMVDGGKLGQVIGSLALRF